MTAPLVKICGIRRADERSTGGTWQSFCVSHGIEDPAWRDHQVGA